MRSIFFKNSSIYFFSSLLNKGLAVLLVPLYTRLLSPSDYGIIDFASISINLFVIIFSLQLNQAIARYYQDFKKKNEEGILIFNSLLLSFGISIFAIVGFVFSLPTFESQLLSDVTHEIFSLILFQSFFQLGFYMIQSVFRYALRVKVENVLNVFLTVLSLSLILFLLVYKGLGLKGVFYAQAISYFIVFSAALILILPSVKVELNKSIIKKILSFSTPLIFSGLSVFVFTYVDRIMVGRYLGIHEMGIYGVALRVVSFSSFIFVSFSNSLVPLTYKSHKENQFKNEIKKVFDIVSIIAAAIFFFLSLFSNEIIHVFATVEYKDAIELIPILLLSTIVSSFSMFYLGLEIAEKTRIISLVYFVGGLANLSMNLVFINYFGIYGASVATLISSIFVLIIRAFLSQKTYKVTYSIFSFLFILGTSGLIIFLDNSFKNQLGLNPIVQKITFIGIWFIFLYLIKEYRKMIKLALLKIRALKA